MTDSSILELMISHHALIESLFFVFKDEVKEKSSRIESSLSELKWEIKKHFFIEENAIFDFLPLRTMDIYRKITHLKEEHVIMVEILEKFSVNLQGITNENVEEFYQLLLDHRKGEEEEVYPILDQEIRPIQKQQIIYRINEVPITIKK